MRSSSRRAIPWAVVLATAAALLVAPGVAPASPCLSGPTGLITIPTALTLKRWEVDLAIDAWRVSRPGSTFSFTDMRASVGFMPEKDTGLEIGLVKPEATALRLSDPYLWGKYRIPGVLPGGALAFGGIFSTDKRNYSTLFVVGSSAIAKSFVLHYGGGINVYGDPLGWSWFGGRQDSGRADPGFAMFGAEFDYRRFKITADYNGSFVSYGVSFFPDSFFSVSAFKLGRGDYERSLGLSHNVGIGATVRF